MTIFYTIVSAMLMSSHVSATNVQRLPKVTVQDESVASKKAKKSFWEGKFLGIPKTRLWTAFLVVAEVCIGILILINPSFALQLILTITTIIFVCKIIA